MWKTTLEIEDFPLLQQISTNSETLEGKTHRRWPINNNLGFPFAATPGAGAGAVAASFF